MYRWWCSNQRVNMVINYVYCRSLYFWIFYAFVHGFKKCKCWAKLKIPRNQVHNKLPKQIFIPKTDSTLLVEILFWSLLLFFFYRKIVSTTNVIFDHYKIFWKTENELTRRLLFSNQDVGSWPLLALYTASLASLNCCCCCCFCVDLLKTTLTVETSVRCRFESVSACKWVIKLLYIVQIMTFQIQRNIFSKCSCVNLTKIFWVETMEENADTCCFATWLLKRQTASKQNILNII